MKFNIIVILLLLGSISVQSQKVLISSGDSWKYLDDGSDQGIAWYESGFDDEAWSSGKTQLGYGDDDETTAMSFGSDTNNIYPTTYFRKSFNVADKDIYNYLVFEAIRDDGMVVYLNGNEIWRKGMPPSHDYLTSASRTIDGDRESTWISTTLNNLLVKGTNVLAVEVHQRRGSSDMSFDFQLTAYNELSAAIIRGPYLQTGTPNSVRIKWRTNVPTESIVHYGTSLNGLENIISDSTQKTEHELSVSGLTPNTKYFYEISDSDSAYVPGNSEMFVITSPPAATKQFVRAWILGDAGTANQNQYNVRDRYYEYVEAAPNAQNQTDMMLFLGDNAYSDGTDSEYQSALFDVYSDMLKKTVAWSTLGNHDGHSATSSTQSGPYYDIFSFPTAGEAGGTSSGTEAYYSFDYANIHFIVLESHQLYNNTTQMDWCLADIQATTQDWIVAFFHHPAYTKGSHDSDIEKELVAMRNNFIPMLEENGVDLVLSGHSHSYERSYFINGHYGIASTFDPVLHTVGPNGNLSGKDDTPDGAYLKTLTNTEGAVYVTTGSAGKISGGSLDHHAMYASFNQLGSSVLEVESDGGTGQKLTVKFLKDNGEISDYFTISKTEESLSENKKHQSYRTSVNLYPNPTEKFVNIEVKENEEYLGATIYSTTGELVIKESRQKINTSSLLPGEYLVKINTDRQSYFKPIVIN